MRYRFGRFSVDRDTRQLLADGTEVHLSPKAFELLVALIDERSRAISKTELQERLWPSTFVGETNLATLVAEIRRALDDSPHDSQYLRTVHRFGYRFVGEIVGDPAPPRGSAGVAPMYLTSVDRQFLLTEGTLLIGRAREAAIQIDAAGVSRHHARLVVRGSEARVEDLGSKNGTFVGGERLTGARLLTDGDEIRIGPVALAFRVAPPTQPTETMNASRPVGDFRE
jgi:DNA-binding winged helix-turn-helix (wHTH) protein